MIHSMPLTAREAPPAEPPRLPRVADFDIHEATVALPLQTDPFADWAKEMGDDVTAPGDPAPVLKLLGQPPKRCQGCGSEVVGELAIDAGEVLRRNTELEREAHQVRSENKRLREQVAEMEIYTERLRSLMGTTARQLSGQVEVSGRLVSDVILSSLRIADEDSHAQMRRVG